MQNLAVSRDDPRYIKGLRFFSMDKPDTLGRRLLAAAQTLSERELVERSFCPEWLTLATRRLLLAWDSLGHPISFKRYSVPA
jgi:hypothetical protein